MFFAMRLSIVIVITVAAAVVSSGTTVHGGTLEYIKTTIGNHCPSDRVVVNEINCKRAANQLAIPYSNLSPGTRYPSGCYYDVQQNKVYFNNIVDPSLIINPFSYYGEICTNEGEEWFEETPDKYCTNHKYDNGETSQLECQKLCEADTGCVGISLTKTTVSLCYLCQDDVLSGFISQDGVSKNYGFYRRPQNDGYEISTNTWCSPFYGKFQTLQEAKSQCRNEPSCTMLYGANTNFQLCAAGSKIKTSSEGNTLYIKRGVPLISTPATTAPDVNNHQSQQQPTITGFMVAVYLAALAVVV